MSNRRLIFHGATLIDGSGAKPITDSTIVVDGERIVTLKGERIAEEFQAIVDDYVRRRYARTAQPAD